VYVQLWVVAGFLVLRKLSVSLCVFVHHLCVCVCVCVHVCVCV
jgi:hypothetical protein